MACKVLHYGLSRNRGGIETYLYKISKQVHQGGIHFSFLDMTGGKACFREELLKLGCDFYDITPRNISLKKNRSELRELFANNHFDVLHFHVNTLSYILPVLEALKSGVKVVIHSRNAGVSNSKFTRLMHVLNQRRLPFSQLKCIAVSNLAGEWLFGKTTPFQVYNNGIDLSAFSFNNKHRIEFRKQWGISDDATVIGNVGAFIEAKNHVKVIEIFKSYLTLDKNAVLLLIGDGELRSQIEDSSKDLGIYNQVVFTGRVTDMASAYSAMDLFLFPSLFEGFPNAVLEAQTCGLPCLISDVITEEVMIQNNCTNLSNKLSPTEWALQIKVNLGEKNIRKNAASEIEAAGFSSVSEINRLKSLYSSMTK